MIILKAFVCAYVCVYICGMCVKCMYMSLVCTHGTRNDSGSHQDPDILLSPSPQCWGYRHPWDHTYIFIWVLEIWTQILMRAHQVFLPAKPSSRHSEALYYIYFLKKLHLFLGGLSVPWHTHSSHRITWRSRLSPPSCEYRVLNIGCKAWWQVLTEPSCWSLSYFFLTLKFYY